LGPEVLISPAIGIAKDAISMLLRRVRRPDPAEVIQRRQKLKTEVEGRLRWTDNSTRYGEAIIRDVKRVDDYPNVDPRSRGISAWYRAGLLGTYHRGIQIGLDFCSLKHVDEKSWHLTRDYDGRDLKAILVGRIPYDRIVVIDWDGDEYYGFPHIYCHFLGWRPSPCEELLLCEEHIENYPNPHSWYSEIISYGEARRLTKEYEPSYFA
jgi:hypothetical protein